MDITPFIRELIVLNECVILRGVGGFETSYKHASLDKKRRIIIPPSKIINFRPDLIQDNGILKDHLVESLEITEKKASKLIDDYVHDFFTVLKEEGKIFLEGIGEFSLDAKNNINFSDIENENYLAESFGLDLLEYDSQSKEEIFREVPLKPVAVQKRKLTGWYIAIGALVLLISITALVLISTSKGVPLFPSTADKSENISQDVIVFGNNEEAMEDSIIKSIERSLSERTVPKKALAVPDTKEHPQQIATNSTDHNYYLIAGSFRNSKNAEILKSQLERKGFKPDIMITGENYYRVIVGSFSDRRAAITELRRIRGQIDQSVWLLEHEVIN